MGLVSDFNQAFRISAAASGGVGTLADVMDDRYFSGGSYMTDSGARVSPELAMQLSAVYACVRVCSESLSSCPINIFKALPDGGKSPAPEHPLYQVLHVRPNSYQTPLEFVEMMQAHVELRGRGIALIVPGGNGAVDKLIPIHPDRVQIFRQTNGQLRYQITSWYDGSIDSYMMEEIFHLRGMSSDGIDGRSPIAAQAQVVGLGLAQQEYASRFFANDSQPRGVLQHPGKLSEPAYQRIKKSFAESQTGVNRHKAAILEEGLQYQAIGFNNRDSQLLEGRQFSRSDIAGFYRVPLHMIGDLSRSAFSNIEQQAIEFVTHNQRPRAVRWEQRIKIDLIDPIEFGGAGDSYFAEFNLDALLRGDLKSRYDAYIVGRNGGWLCTNDIRRKENMNPVEGGDSDFLQPLNMVKSNEAPGPDAIDPTSGDEDAGAAEASLREFAKEGAERMVRKEVTALRKAWTRTKTAEAFALEATEFYVTHADLIASSLKISREQAATYCRLHLGLLIASFSGRGVEVMLSEIEEYAPAQLAEKALVKFNYAKALATSAKGKKR